MAKIIWSTGDTFQVLSTLEIPESLDVEVYGVFVKSGCLLIGKTKTDTQSEGVIGTMSARSDFKSKEWEIFHCETCVENGYPDAVPLDTKTQWLPKEVKLIFTALKLAENAPVRSDPSP